MASASGAPENLLSFRQSIPGIVSTLTLPDHTLLENYTEQHLNEEDWIEIQRHTMDDEDEGSLVLDEDQSGVVLPEEVEEEEERNVDHDSIEGFSMAHQTAKTTTVESTSSVQDNEAIGFSTIVVDFNHNSKKPKKRLSLM